MSSEEFIGSDCGKYLLNLVARGSAILAQMQRLSQHIPNIFQRPGKKYKKIIYDFTEYFPNMNQIQGEIESSIVNIDEMQELLQINENIKSTYMPLLQKFYRLFESIITYYQSLTRFVQEIQTGIFMEFSLQNMFQIIQGKQLISEAFYLFGVMLLLMDRIIEGQIRQRIVVFYYRCKGGQSAPRINEIRRLCTDRGFRVDQQTKHELGRPQNYPQQLFELFPLDKDVLDSIILAIKDDDIYKQMPAYPQASLRSFALTNQSSMIFVLLFMRKKILYEAKGTMRQIVDKHFYNMWVIPFYLGNVVDLTYWWKPYKAAKLALNNILDIQTIQETTNEFSLKITQCYVRCRQFLSEGVMTDEFVLQRLSSLMNSLRQCNITLRWLILHRLTVHKQLKQIILQATNPVDILKLLLVCAQYESILKERCESLLDKKQSIWEQDRQACVQRMKELAQYFGSEKVLAKIQSDNSFQIWFTQIAQVIESITYTNATYASRKIQQVMNSLEDIEQYHQISSSIQIKQYLFDTRRDLNHMIKIVNIKKSTLTFIQIISDITWSWTALKDYIKYIQKQIRKNPDISLLLKNTFMKLSSILNTPMVRIMQASSPDMESVSNYYSNQLVKVVKDVLQVIPRLVFQLLGYIVNIFQEKMENEPLKFDKAELPKYAQFQQRLQIANYNREISLFVKSILNMESYLLGVIEINPRQILQNGIRKQLIRLLAKILESSLTVEANTSEAFMKKIIGLSKKLKSFKISLEYVQDFVHIYGLKIYYEQFEKLITSYVDMEKTALILGQVGYEQLNYDIDIPAPTLKDQQFNTFLGYILRQLINLTNSKYSTFVLTTYAFYNTQTKKETVTLKMLNILHQCIGIGGLQGLDYLLSIKIMKSMERLVKLFQKTCSDENYRKLLSKCYSQLRNSGAFSDRYDTTITILKKNLKVINNSATVELMKIGNYMLLRDMICLELRLLGKVGCPRLFLVLENINNSLLNELISNQQKQLQQVERLDNENLLLALVNPYFKHLGMLEPMKKVFVTPKPLQYLPLLLFTIISSNISEMDYDNKLKSLMKVNKKQRFQPNYFLTGILCFLQQFHPSNKQTLFAYLGSYIKSTVNFVMTNREVIKNPQTIADMFTYIRFFEEAIKFSRQPYEKYKGILDLGLFSSLDKETFKTGHKL